ncbi:3-alpha,7-alpha,12-alpha-trihydroxy-5-beta-cholest-24-enoyl-CoA hydratase [Ferrovibrio terrae]|uniref:3-alpha,7-alpha, 12-alpha-trihydroxy-5-beta-cholest-24-enoyl-CoA hydratase n=1 Tax=Ferrovibrio terrae TaxID=2594003 RepID=A0A516GXW4_9PROT|nr:MaoC/PaaZ C-terminal domain-containing protein [Ferrovibrio terrae]QDO96384.1 3-alpha,7-alpha,12-alpha-trihydroxy-5-beta-cholest-24-enoyl-CoA hydratase [Ferrovibrio terrae]
MSALFDPQRLFDWRFEDKQHSYDARDAILYALGVGLPLTPGDTPDLRFLMEDRLRVLPTYAVTLASPGMWVKAPELGIDWPKLLHVGQAARFIAELPPQARIIGRARIKSLHDRGVSKGAICVVEREISDASTGELYCSIDQTLLLRGNGGFGGSAPPDMELLAPPGREADLDETVTVSPRGALIYRLSGDVNPLHADYEIARRAGFERPILHGLATYGLAGALVMMRFCDAEPRRLKALRVRFAGIVLPGDAVRFRFWHSGDVVWFDAFVGERKVLDQGIAEIG